jgi:two-component system invasion response regulator UvrY
LINVLLVDAHDLVRLGIKRLLADAKGITVIGEAETGEEAVKLSRSLTPNIVLLDANMPGIGGLEACRRIIRHNPDIKVITLTAHYGEPFPSRFLQAGASGYLTKGTGIVEMVKAIRNVNAGQR